MIDLETRPRIGPPGSAQGDIPAAHGDTKLAQDDTQTAQGDTDRPQGDARLQGDKNFPWTV